MQSVEWGMPEGSGSGQNMDNTLGSGWGGTDLGEAFVEGDDAGGHVADVEFLGDALSSVGTHALTEAGVGGQFGDGCGHRLRVGGRHEKAGFAIGDLFGGATDIGSDDG